MPPTAGNSTLIDKANVWKKGTKPTLKQFMYTYAPPNENNTDGYISSIVSSLSKNYPKFSKDSIVFDYLSK